MSKKTYNLIVFSAVVSLYVHERGPNKSYNNFRACLPCTLTANNYGPPIASDYGCLWSLTTGSMVTDNQHHGVQHHTKTGLEQVWTAFRKDAVGYVWQGQVQYSRNCGWVALINTRTSQSYACMQRFFSFFDVRRVPTQIVFSNSLCFSCVFPVQPQIFPVPIYTKLTRQSYPASGKN